MESNYNMETFTTDMLAFDSHAAEHAESSIEISGNFLSQVSLKNVDYLTYFSIFLFIFVYLVGFDDCGSEGGE